MYLIIGGPAYRMEVDAHHAASMTLLALTARDIGVRVVAAHYEHGTPVAYARNSMFAKSLTDLDATHLYWMDADCSIPPDHFGAILIALDKAAPITIVPTPQRDGAINVWLSQTERPASILTDGKLLPCKAGGFGGVAFDLRWYRKHWPTRPWFHDGWSDEVAALNPQGDGTISEDYNHCLGVAERGGIVQYVGAVLRHRHRGGE